MLSDVEEILRLSDENLRLREELKVVQAEVAVLKVFNSTFDGYSERYAKLEAQLETAREALGAMKPMLRDFCRLYCQPWREGGHVSGCVDAEAALAKIGGSQ